MPTECSADLFGFARVEGRAVVASFDGGALTSDAGALLLGATDRAIGLVERFAACFRDARAAGLIEHEVHPLVGQRVFVMALGYAAGTSWRPSYGARTSTRRRERSRRLPASWHRSAVAGRGCASCCAPIAGSAGKTSWRVRGARGGLSVRPGALFGLARNDRLAAEIATEIVTEIVTELAAAQTEAGRTGKPARRFKDFTWSTRHSWSRSGRVVAKVEWTRGEANPRFVVTSLVNRRAKGTLDRQEKGTRFGIGTGLSR